jgi:hypothetical protein
MSELVDQDVDLRLHWQAPFEKDDLIGPQPAMPAPHPISDLAQQSLLADPETELLRRHLQLTPAAPPRAPPPWPPSRCEIRGGGARCKGSTPAQ